MATPRCDLRLAPENEDDKIVVSKKGLAELKRALRALEEPRRTLRRTQYVVGYPDPKHVYSLTPSPFHVYA